MNEMRNECNELLDPSSSPRRVQRKRTKGWLMPPNTVSVCRPGKWGNPFKIGEPISENNPQIVSDADMATACFRVNLLRGSLGISVEDVKAELQGKNLACFCKLGQPCHAEVLIHFANSNHHA